MRDCCAMFGCAFLMACGIAMLSAAGYAEKIFEKVRLQAGKRHREREEETNSSLSGEFCHATSIT